MAGAHYGGRASVESLLAPPSNVNLRVWIFIVSRLDLFKHENAFVARKSIAMILSVPDTSLVRAKWMKEHWESHIAVRMSWRKRLERN